MLPKIVSLASLIVLLAWMIYFLMGGLPLLILKHDDATDGRLVRGFFNVHYRVLMGVATIGALSAAYAEHRNLAIAIGSIAAVGFLARQFIVPRMDRLRALMSAADASAVKSFRRLHISGLALNACLLVSLFFVLSQSAHEVFPCSDTPPGCRGADCKVQCSLL